MCKVSKLFSALSFCLLFLSQGISPSLADPLDAPKLEDNKILFYCKQQMTTIFHQLVGNKNQLSDELTSRVSRLLMSAEIDGQLKNYPSCFNKLERARFYLRQAGLTVDLPPPPDNKPGTFGTKG